MTIGQKPEPDVDIETGLVTGVTAWRWTTSGLTQITNGEDAQILLSCGRRQVLEVSNERGMAKKAAPVAPLFRSCPCRKAYAASGSAAFSCTGPESWPLASTSRSTNSITAIAALSP